MPIKNKRLNKDWMLSSSAPTSASSSPLPGHRNSPRQQFYRVRKSSSSSSLTVFVGKLAVLMACHSPQTFFTCPCILCSRFLGGIEKAWLIQTILHLGIERGYPRSSLFAELSVFNLWAISIGIDLVNLTSLITMLPLTTVGRHVLVRGLRSSFKETLEFNKK